MYINVTAALIYKLNRLETKPIGFNVVFSVSGSRSNPLPKDPITMVRIVTKTHNKGFSLNLDQDFSSNAEIENVIVDIIKVF